LPLPWISGACLGIGAALLDNGGHLKARHELSPAQVPLDVLEMDVLIGNAELVPPVLDGHAVFFIVQRNVRLPSAILLRVPPGAPIHSPRLVRGKANEQPRAQ